MEILGSNIRNKLDKKETKRTKNGKFLFSGNITLFLFFCSSVRIIVEYPSTSDGNSVHSGYERLPLQCHPCLENGDFFITFLFIVHKLAACYADNVVDETFASLFHRFVFKDNAGVEVNPAVCSWRGWSWWKSSWSVRTFRTAFRGLL